MQITPWVCCPVCMQPTIPLASDMYRYAAYYSQYAYKLAIQYANTPPENVAERKMLYRRSQQAASGALKGTAVGDQLMYLRIN